MFDSTFWKQLLYCRRIVIMFVFGTVVARSALDLRASELIRPGLSDVAKDIVKLMRLQGAKTISVQEPDGPTAYGTAIRRDLQRELLRVGASYFGEKFIDSNEPEIRLTGSFYEERDSLRIEFEFKDGANKPIKFKTELPASTEDKNSQFSIDQHDLSDGILKIGFQEPAVAASAFGRSKDLLNNRSCSVDNSSRAVECLGLKFSVVRNGKVVELKQVADSTKKKRGDDKLAEYDIGTPREAMVDLASDDEFCLRINNPFPFTIGVEFEIDGINSFALSEEKNRKGEGFSRWVMHANCEPFDLKGWYKTAQHSSAFKVTDFSQGVATRLGRLDSARLGTITAYVYRLKAPTDNRTLAIKNQVFNETHTLMSENGQIVQTTSAVTKQVPKLIGEGSDQSTDYTESDEDLIQGEKIALLCIRYDKLPSER